MRSSSCITVERNSKKSFKNWTKYFRLEILQVSKIFKKIQDQKMTKKLKKANEKSGQRGPHPSETAQRSSKKSSQDHFSARKSHGRRRRRKKHPKTRRMQIRQRQAPTRKGNARTEAKTIFTTENGPEVRRQESQTPENEDVKK